MEKQTKLTEMENVNKIKNYMTSHWDCLTLERAVNDMKILFGVYYSTKDIITAYKDIDDYCYDEEDEKFEKSFLCKNY